VRVAGLLPTAGLPQAENSRKPKTSEKEYKMAGLSNDEITSRLSDVPDWSYDGNQLTRTFSFDGFMPAIDFVGNIATAAEAADHHPDIDIRYSNVKVSVSSHDVGGITERDFKLVAEVSRLA
jgi:4a-hydroxytetrahydrobiopterin dehydratase